MKQVVWAEATGIVHHLRSVLDALYLLILNLGGPGLFFLALADSSFLSIPEGNDILIIVLSTGRGWQEMAYYVTMTTAGSVTGCFLLYSVGRRGGGFLRRKLSPERVERIGKAYRRWGILAIVVPSILPPPTPFKVFVLSAGLFQLPRIKFLLAVAVGRSFRYFSWGVLAVLYGEWAKKLLEENLHSVGLALFLLFLAVIAGYALVRFLARRRAPQGGTT